MAGTFFQVEQQGRIENDQVSINPQIIGVHPTAEPSDRAADIKAAPVERRFCHVLRRGGARKRHKEK